MNCRIGQENICSVNGCAFLRAGEEQCPEKKVQFRERFVDVPGKQPDFLEQVEKASINQKVIELKPAKKITGKARVIRSNGQDKVLPYGTIDVITLQNKPLKDFKDNPSKCPYCGDPITNKNCSKEHFIAKSKGGRLKIWTCKTCNELKGHLSIEDMLQHIEKIIKNCQIKTTEELLLKLYK